MTRDERQELSIKRVKESNYNGCLDYTPRFGKTRTAIKIIQSFQKEVGKNVLIIVPSSQIEKQWIEEINIYKLRNVYVRTINRMINQYYDTKDTTKPDLLIVDEIQNYMSNMRVAIITDKAGVKSNYKIALTGTYPTSPTEKNLELIKKYYPIIDVIEESEAIGNNWICDYEEYNIELILPEKDEYRYIRFTNLISETMQLFRNSRELFRRGNTYLIDNDYRVILACKYGLRVNKKLTKSDKGTYIKSVEIRDYIASSRGWKPGLDLSNTYNKTRESIWNPDKIQERVDSFEDFVNKRLELINSHPKKLELVLELVEKYKDKNIIIFNQSIPFADKITEEINKRFGNIAICFHSKISSRPLVDFSTGEYHRYKSGAKKGEFRVFGKKLIKEYAIEGIKQGQFKVLVTVNSLNEGFNEESMEIAISTSGTTNPIEYKQRTSRVKTYNPTTEKEVKIFNMYFKHIHLEKSDGNIEFIKSVDKTKLVKRQSESEGIIHWICPDDIKNI